jgi:anti-anti-sigma regulatory factor
MTEPRTEGAVVPWSARREGPVLYLSGDIDLIDGIELTHRIVVEVSLGAVVLDLTGVGFCGAAGVRAVLQGHAARHDGVTLQVRCAGFVLQVLEICGLDRVDGLCLVDVSHSYPAPLAGEL